jgi:hypothetical protein
MLDINLYAVSKSLNAQSFQFGAGCLLICGHTLHKNVQPEPSQYEKLLISKLGKLKEALSHWNLTKGAHSDPRSSIGWMLGYHLSLKISPLSFSYHHLFLPIKRIYTNYSCVTSWVALQSQLKCIATKK